MPGKDQSLIIDQHLAQHYHIAAAQVIVGHQVNQEIGKEVEVKLEINDCIAFML